MKQADHTPDKKVEKLDAPLMKKMIMAATLWLNKNQAEVDALNVFPVPDGDTGTNMYLTLLDAAREVENIEENEISRILEAFAKGSLMGARGNSGVILSQVFRGFANGARNKNTINTREFASALTEASKKAYKAVMKPVEGTILTVVREAAMAAEKEAKKTDDIRQLLEVTLLQAEQTLDRTPEMLKVLKDANVVDAGGRGFCLILEGYLRALRGDTALEQEIKMVGTAEKVKQLEPEKLEFAYCTEFLIKGNEIDLEIVRKNLDQYGDSLLVVGSTEVTKVHIHTNNPGKVLDHGVQHGRLSKIKIENMEEQTEERYSAVNHAVEEEQIPMEKDFGVVAVVAGDGLGEIFSSLGADELVTGGQSMNPSTQDLAEGCEKIPSERIIILPNNKNVIFAAEQVKEICDKEVHVLPSCSIPEGIAALMRINPEESLESVLQEMNNGLQEIKTGEVTFAVRDSNVNGMEIKEGDVIGLYGGELISVNNEVGKVALELLQEMVTEDDFLITIYRGEKISEEEGETIKEELAREFPDCDLELYPGNQPLYYLIISVE